MKNNNNSFEYYDKIIANLKSHSLFLITFSKKSGISYNKLRKFLNPNKTEKIKFSEEEINRIDDAIYYFDNNYIDPKKTKINVYKIIYKVLNIFLISYLLLILIVGFSYVVANRINIVPTWLFCLLLLIPIISLICSLIVYFLNCDCHNLRFVIIHFLIISLVLSFSLVYVRVGKISYSDINNINDELNISLPTNNNIKSFDTGSGIFYLYTIDDEQENSFINSIKNDDRFLTNSNYKNFSFLIENHEFMLMGNVINFYKSSNNVFDIYSKITSNDIDYIIFYSSQINYFIIFKQQLFYELQIK